MNECDYHLHSKDGRKKPCPVDHTNLFRKNITNVLSAMKENKYDHASVKQYTEKIKVGNT